MKGDGPISDTPIQTQSLNQKETEPSGIQYKHLHKRHPMFKCSLVEHFVLQFLQ